MALHYVDVTEANDQEAGTGLAELYLVAEVWPDLAVHRAWKDWQTGVDLAVLDGVVFGNTAGEYPVLVNNLGEFYWVSASLTTYNKRDAAGALTLNIPIPIGPTSQGFAYWDYGTGQIVWMDTVLANPVPFSRRYQHNDWAFGLSNTSNAVQALEISTGNFYHVASVYTPVQAKGRDLGGGNAICAISLPDDDSTYFVPTPFTLISGGGGPPTPPPPPIIPPGASAAGLAPVGRARTGARRVYPDVNQMTDRAGQQSTQKLWDRVQAQSSEIAAERALREETLRRLDELEAERRIREEEE
jgi:hypothetical protein